MTRGNLEGSPPSGEGLPHSPDSITDTGRLPSNQKRQRLTRLVSQDELGMAACTQSNIKSGEAKHTSLHNKYNHKLGVLNPLAGAKMLCSHVAAVRLEADLHPLRSILSRLMTHQTHNRKGLFNHPVDPLALGLPDYHLIVKRPMDLGAVKRKLHAIAYNSREEAIDDIRLVFENAMRYNPPQNPVHISAQELLASFDASVKILAPCSSSSLGGSGSTEQAPTQWEPQKGPAADISESTLTPPSGINKLPAPATNAPKPFLCGRGRPPALKSKLPPFLPHSCDSCKGRKCAICKQGCLTHEPCLLVCQGYSCGGSKIRKGAPYYVSDDGNRQFCQRCYTNLPPVLPNPTEGSNGCRYKQDLLKRKNEEEIPEDWIDCSKCGVGVHSICAMHNPYVHSREDYACGSCSSDDEAQDEWCHEVQEDEYTYASGSEDPVPMSEFGVSSSGPCAANLPVCRISAFIEEKVRSRMRSIPNADKTVCVRVISDCDRHFTVPDIIRRHFRMASRAEVVTRPPKKVNFRQKAIALFQRIDGLDVCTYCMYVQEYDGNDQYEDIEEPRQVSAPHKKRVYIAYIDSVEHFRPRQCRTQVYHEILVSYLATARARGYTGVQIWACPPSRGNSFIFWNHPASQRTPTKERLTEWYHGALSSAVSRGVVTDVKSLFESDFEEPLRHLEKETEDVSNASADGSQSGRMVCPPLLEGDFWIEEALRLHHTNISRHIRVRAPTEVCVWNVSPLASNDLDPCPALQIATLIKDRIMTHPSSASFRRPVNAATMKLKNYHQIVTEPIDLGTIYSRCILGEYSVLREVVEDVQLMVSNAKKFNPVGHFVYVKADEVLGLFFSELEALVDIWNDLPVPTGKPLWEKFSEQSMSLDATMEVSTKSTAPRSTSVVIEDDRSSDGSRSVSSFASLPASPVSGGSYTEVPANGAQQPSKARSGPKNSARRLSKINKKTPPRKLSLLVDGPEAISHAMVGEDFWLLDKRNPTPPKGACTGKKKGCKRRRSSVSIDISADDTVQKRRRQSWLGEEVGNSVRKMRTSFFSCSLVPKANMSEAEMNMAESYKSYANSFCLDDYAPAETSSPLTDSRQSLLEFSQFRHFEFDTLRRAKYSTAMLLYHIHNKGIPGTLPTCTSCDTVIKEVRWHKVKKIAEKRRMTKASPKKEMPSEPRFICEELCVGCFKDREQQDDFIPVPVSLSTPSH